VLANGLFPSLGDHPGISGITKTGTGAYDLTLTAYPANGANLMVTFGVNNGTGQISWTTTGSPIVSIHTATETGVPADRAFTIVCFDTTP
jgi:hypothetical protein